MLAALSHHITKLEQKIDEQSQELELLKLRESSCDCTSDVASLRLQVSDNRSRLDCLSARVDKSVAVASAAAVGTAACKTVASSKEIKLEILKPPASFQYDDRPYRGGGGGGVGGSTVQIGGGAFSKPVSSSSSGNRLPMASAAGGGENTHLTPSEFFSTFSNFQLLDINTHKPPHVTSTHLNKPTGGSFTNVSVIAKPTQSELCALNRSSSSRCCDVGSGGGGGGSGSYGGDRTSRHDLLTSPQSSFTSIVPGMTSSSSPYGVAWSTANDVIKQPPSSPQQRKSQGSSSDISLDNIRAIAAENSGLRNQLVCYRKKVEGLEQALAVKDVTLVELRNQCDHGAHKEREWEQRQDWLEHKLKLLKQDKRRRGETIGKLLKVIDDLKDGGRLDESRVKDGRAVLNMTLQTRHLQHDERVCRVVDAVEFDRVPRTSTSNTPSRQGTPDGCCGGNENCNNSQRYIEGASASLTLRHDVAMGHNDNSDAADHDVDDEVDDTVHDDDDEVASLTSSSCSDSGDDTCYSSCSSSSCSICEGINVKDDVTTASYGYDVRSSLGDCPAARSCPCNVCDCPSYDRYVSWQQ